MAIKSLEGQKKRQRILLIATAGIILIAVIILYFSFWQKTTPEEASLPAESLLTQEKTVASEKKLERINLDFSFLVDRMLPFLRSHGDLPVKKGETGRDNPFILYWLEQTE